jgi:hypothetical protein
MKKNLIIFRLYDRNYCEKGNPETLVVYLGEDNVIRYSLYGGWQDSGMGYAISSLQLKESLPMNPALFRNTEELRLRINAILRTVCGSHDVHSYEILNELKEKPKVKRTRKPSKPNQKLVDAVIEDLKESFAFGDYTVLEELLFFIPKDNLIQALPEELWEKFK